MGWLRKWGDKAWDWIRDDLVDYAIGYVGGVYYTIYKYVVGGVAQWGSASGGGAGESVNEYIRGRGITESVDAFYDRFLIWQRPENWQPYDGPGYYADRSGFSISLATSLYSVGSNPPNGSAFLGHAPPDYEFDSIRATITGPSIDDKNYGRVGFACRLTQILPDGTINYINGIELGVDEAGQIRREDLRPIVGSPFTFSQSYGGPVVPEAPMFVDVQPFGDFSLASGVDRICVGVTATFFAKEIQ